MKLKKHGQYFWKNMRLFFVIITSICLIAFSVNLYSTYRNNLRGIESNYETQTGITAAEIDRKLFDIHRLMENIAQITWVKKMSTSSDVFLQQFTAVERVEYQRELSQNMAIDDDITDIGIYLSERKVVLSQKGWFTEDEYKSYLAQRTNLDVDRVFSYAQSNNRLRSFSELDINTGDNEDIILYRNLVDVASPPASLFIIIDKSRFNDDIKGFLAESAVAITVKNSVGLDVFSAGNPTEDQYYTELQSEMFSLTYGVYYTKPSVLLNQLGYANISIFMMIIGVLLAAIIISYVLTWYSNRPIRGLMVKITELVDHSNQNDEVMNEISVIERSFLSLYHEKKSLQASIKDNVVLTRQYALMLILSGDERFLDWMQHFDDLSIGFTDDQYYSVWLIAQEQSDVTIQIEDMVTEIHPQFASIESLKLSALSSVLILGTQEDNRNYDREELKNTLILLAYERHGVILNIDAGDVYGPGIKAISESYHKCNNTGESVGNIEEFDLRGLEIKNYIEANFNDPDISLKDLGSRWDLAVPTISRLFKETVGVNFLEYLTDLRLNRAKELLSETDLSIAEVASNIGYGSEYSFRRAFQRNENCRVQDWIPLNRKESNEN